MAQGERVSCDLANPHQDTQRHRTLDSGRPDRGYTVVSSLNIHMHCAVMYMYVAHISIVATRETQDCCREIAQEFKYTCVLIHVANLFATMST